MKQTRVTNILLSLVIASTTLFMFGCNESVEKHDETPLNSESEQQAVLPDVTEGDNTTKKNTTVVPLPESAFMTAEWLDLIPQEDLDALFNPPSYLDDIEENSLDDQVNNALKNITDDPEAERYQQALVSTRVIPELNNVPIRMPAFIVPLEFDDEQRVIQFFMVPFFGACIHEPPPPPNQTIFVDYPQGFELESLIDPYWISGVLKTSLVENDMAIAAYTLEMHDFELYTEE